MTLHAPGLEPRSPSKSLLHLLFFIPIPFLRSFFFCSILSPTSVPNLVFQEFSYSYSSHNISQILILHLACTIVILFIPFSDTYLSGCGFSSSYTILS